MVNSEPLARLAWAQVVERHGATLDDETYAEMVGLRLADCALLVRSKLHLAADPSELAGEKQVALAEIRASGVPPMPGLRTLLKSIEQRSIPWAIATSSTREEAMTVLRQLDLKDSFGALAAGDEVNRGKPAPDVYELAARRLQVAPERCLALEDSVPGAKAAVSAGMVTIAVPNGFTTKRDFPFVDYIYDSLAGVAQDLDRLIKAR